MSDAKTSAAEKKEEQQPYKDISFTTRAGVSRKLIDTLLVNEQIIKSLEVNRSRTHVLLDKYLEEIHNELRIPMNKYMHWYNVVKPFMEQVLTTKIMDNELITRYQTFVDDLISHDQDYEITRDEIEKVREQIDYFLEIILRLEEKLSNVKYLYFELSKKKQVRIIELYQYYPEKLKNKNPGFCKLCGEHVEKDSPSKTVCLDCLDIDETPEKKEIEDTQVTDDDDVHAEPESEKPPQEETEEPIEDEVLENESLEEPLPGGGLTPKKAMKITQLINELDNKYNLNKKSAVLEVK